MKEKNLLKLKHYYFILMRDLTYLNHLVKEEKSTKRTIYLHQWESKEWKCHRKSCCKFIRKIPQVYN